MMNNTVFQIKALLSYDDFILYASDITKHLVDNYPDFHRWFFKVASELPSPDRKVYVSIIEDKVVGIVIFKRGDENKLCTLYIDEKYQGYGIGSAFIRLVKDYYADEAFNLTIAEKTYLSCKDFFIKNGFFINRVFNGENMPDIFNGVYLKNQNELMLTCNP